MSMLALLLCSAMAFAGRPVDRDGALNLMAAGPDPGWVELATWVDDSPPGHEELRTGQHLSISQLEDLGYAVTGPWWVLPARGPAVAAVPVEGRVTNAASDAALRVQLRVVPDVPVRDPRVASRAPPDSWHQPVAWTTLLGAEEELLSNLQARGFDDPKIAGVVSGERQVLWASWFHDARWHVGHFQVLMSCYCRAPGARSA